MKLKPLALAVVPLVLVLGTASAPGRRAPASTPERLIERIGQQLRVSEIPCAAVPRLPPGALLCGTYSNDDFGRVAHQAAFELAAEGVPLLELQYDTVPTYQLVGHPGFRSLEPVDGLDVRAFLIDRSRVGVWVGSGFIVFTLEEFDEPFPLNMPATVGKLE